MFLFPNKIASQVFLRPEGDAPNGGGGVNVNDKDDMINFFAADDEPKEDLLEEDTKKAKKNTESKEDAIDIEDDEETDEEDSENEEDTDDLEELEKELEEPTEEQLELTTPVRRQEILKKYPTLFKDFPYLEKAYYREQQFTELLPTIEDAKEAVESRQTLQRFEGDLMQGNIETILQAVHGEDPNSFYKIVDELLPTLARVDERAYHHLLGNNIKHTVAAMVQEGRKSNNDVLLSAAQILNQFVFGNSEFTPPTRLSKDTPPAEKSKESELTQREREFMTRQFETTRGELNTRINNALKSTIEAHIDPKGSMTDYVRRNAIREVNENLGNYIAQDTRFKALVDRLWQHAFKSNFSKDSTDKIRSAYLSKAKTLLPSVIKKARNEALRGMGKRVSDSKPETKTTERSTRSKVDTSGNSKSKSEPQKGESTLDFLMRD